MRYPFYTADVFTNQIFGGNPLAVFPNAEGLNSQQMQQVAAEFNYSETVFVFPPETPQGTRKLRIFTPKIELPFAGHPTVGTAYILALMGEIFLESEVTNIIFEEGIGLIPVKIYAEGGEILSSELTAVKLPEFGTEAPVIEDLAAILSLEVSDFLGGENSPQAVSCGVPFLFVPISNRQKLSRIKFNREIWQQKLASSWANSLYIFCFDPELENSDLRARMFAPAMGIEEDPATGAAATALGGYLGIRNPLIEGTLGWIVEQGFEMGRPSIIQVEVDKMGGLITEIRVSGASVLVSEGMMEIP